MAEGQLRSGRGITPEGCQHRGGREGRTGVDAVSSQQIEVLLDSANDKLSSRTEHCTALRSTSYPLSYRMLAEDREDNRKRSDVRKVMG